MASQIIGTRAANALVEDAEISLPGWSGLDLMLPQIRAVERALTAYRTKYGGLWVGGHPLHGPQRPRRWMIEAHT
jgi:hypothetical protein